MVGRGLLRLRGELVALKITGGNPEWPEQLLWLLPGLAWLVLPLLLCRRMILFVEGPSIIMHDFALRMVDEQSILVLLRSQLSQRLVLENRPLDDLHYFVLVENARAQLRLDEALNLRGAQYCLGRAGLQLARPHICQITARDDASVGGACAG